jgi:REP element-mobilizing transposase RayT
MRYLDRKDAPDAVWHVSCRVNWQTWHLATERAFEIFLECLDRAVQRFAMDLFSLVLMSNHFHAVLRSPPEAVYRQLTGRRTRCRHFRPYPKGHPQSTVIGQCLQHMKIGVARRIQAALDLHGHFWDGKHFRRKLNNADDLVIAIAYDHRNPVRKAMVAKPEDYPRSSAAWWAGQGVSPLPLCRRAELPFGLGLEPLREAILRLQREKRLDDVMEAFQRSGLSLDTRKGRDELERMMRDAGLDPSAHLVQVGGKVSAARMPHHGDANPYPKSGLQRPEA